MRCETPGSVFVGFVPSALNPKLDTLTTPLTLTKAVRFVKLTFIYVLIIISYHNYWVVRPVDLDDYSDCTIAPVALDLSHEL